MKESVWWYLDLQILFKLSFKYLVGPGPTCTLLCNEGISSVINIWNKSSGVTACIKPGSVSMFVDILALAVSFWLFWLSSVVQIFLELISSVTDMYNINHLRMLCLINFINNNHNLG